MRKCKRVFFVVLVFIVAGCARHNVVSPEEARNIGDEEWSVEKVAPRGEGQIDLVKNNKNNKTGVPNKEGNVNEEKMRQKLPAKGEELESGIALIIGNRNYSDYVQDVPNVSYAHNDADAMARYAKRTLGFREGNIKVLKDATGTQLKTWLGTKSHPQGRLADWVKPGESEVFVFYSGHGVPGMDKGRGYLLPVDGSPNQAAITGYPIRTFYKNLSQLPAKNVTVAMDACFSGRSPGGAVVQNASPATLEVQTAKPDFQDGAVFTASAADQVASWDNEARLGLFTHYWLEGVSGEADLNNDGRVLASELQRYLKEEVRYQARRRYSRKQVPQLFGEDDLVVSTVQ